MNDEELNLLLAEFRKKEPSDLQVHKWKLAIRKEVHSARQPRQNHWFQVVAASVVGFVVGGLVFGLRNSHYHWDELAENDSENATIEYVLTKTN